MQGHGRHGGLKSKTAFGRIFVLQRGVADCLNFLITSLSIVLEGRELRERLMRGLAPHLCCTEFDNMFLMLSHGYCSLFLSHISSSIKQRRHFGTDSLLVIFVDLIFPVVFMSYNIFGMRFCVYITGCIFGIWYFSSDTRGHKINVKNIYTRRLDTQIVDASRSKDSRWKFR